MFARLLTVFLALTAVVAHPAPDAEADVEERDLHRRAPMASVITKCVNSKQIALTFDDGPYIYTKQLVDTLKNYSAKATFFINGRNYRCIYDSDMVSAVQYAYKAGHQIGSHTWRHANLATLSRTQVNDEMAKVETAMQKILGVTPAMMRPPYGSYNNMVREVAKSRNQSLIIWNFDSGDSAGKSVSASQKMYTDAANKKTNYLLALNHDVYQNTVKSVAPHALKVFRDKGYKFVTVAECLNAAPYKSKGTAGKRDSSWKC